MKKIFLRTILCTLLIITSSAYAKDQVIIYEFIDGKGSKEDIETHTVTIEPQKKDTLKFARQIVSDESTLNTEFILNKNYETVQFRAKNSEGDTDYEGRLEGRTIFITGVASGLSIDKTIELDEKPFYYTPKFNLSRFALSKDEEVQFWMLRKDTFSKYLMQAKREGEETLLIDGKKVPAIKIYYSATGKGERFYKRIYYFRKSDGLFIMKKNSDNSPEPSGIFLSES